VPPTSPSDSLTDAAIGGIDTFVLSSVALGAPVALTGGLSAGNAERYSGDCAGCIFVTLGVSQPMDCAVDCVASSLGGIIIHPASVCRSFCLRPPWSLRSLHGDFGARCLVCVATYGL
jgi:hypothetical protein